MSYAQDVTMWIPNTSCHKLWLLEKSINPALTTVVECSVIGFTILVLYRTGGSGHIWRLA